MNSSPSRSSEDSLDDSARPLQQRLFMALLILVVSASIPGCSCSEAPPPAPDPQSVEIPALGDEAPDLVEEEDIWAAPVSLNHRSGLQPKVATRLADLERDYFEGRFGYVVQEGRDLLDMVGDNPKMQLRLYYLMARGFARDRQPSEARRYEKLFRDLFLKLYEKPPRSAGNLSKIRGVIEKSEKAAEDEIHAGWTEDADGAAWANVRIFRELDRAGGHAVITRDHPGGGTIHASMSRANLVAYLEDLGSYDSETTVLLKDQRFGFSYQIVEVRR